MSKKTTLTGLLGPKLPPEVWAGADLEEELARLSLQAMDIAEHAKLSRREIARRMGSRSPSTVQRIVGAEAYNVTVETLMRFARACGFHLDVRFSPIAGGANGMSAPRLRLVEPTGPAESLDGDDLDLAA